MFKIKSKLNEGDLSTRSIYLLKNTTEEKTTESFLNIEDRPENTCPFIDDSLDEDRKIKKLIDKAFEQLQEFIKNPLPIVKDATCPCESSGKYLKKQFKHMIDDLTEIESVIEKISVNLELLRTACEETREYGKGMKEFFWKLVGLDGNIDQKLVVEYHKIKSLRPSFDIKYFETEKLYKSVPDVKRRFILLCDFEPCPNDCECYLKLATVDDIRHNIFDDLKLEIPDSLQGAFDNLIKLNDWCDNLEEQVDILMRGESEINFNKEEILNKYLETRNESQKIRNHALLRYLMTMEGYQNHKRRLDQIGKLTPNEQRYIDDLKSFWSDCSIVAKDISQRTQPDDEEIYLAMIDLAEVFIKNLRTDIGDNKLASQVQQDILFFIQYIKKNAIQTYSGTWDKSTSPDSKISNAVIHAA